MSGVIRGNQWRVIRGHLRQKAAHPVVRRRSTRESHVRSSLAWTRHSPSQRQERGRPHSQPRSARGASPVQREWRRHQQSSDVISSHHLCNEWRRRGPSEAISGASVATECPSAISGNQWCTKRQSVVIRGDPSHSHLMRGAIMGNERCHQRRSEPFAPECLSGAWDVISSHQ